MTTESKIGKIVINIGFFLLPIMTIHYIFWVENPQFYIFLKYYKAILYGCNLALWTGFFLALFSLAIRKHVAPGVLLFITTMPFLFMSSFLSYDDGTTLSNNIAQKLDTLQIGDDTYYLTSENGDWGHYHLSLYKCKKHELYCEQLLERYSYDEGYFVEDVSNGEINIVNWRGELIYTYGENSRSYDPYSQTQFENHLYYLSEECSKLKNHRCALFIYTLYKCNLDNALCEQLPFKFEIIHEVDLYLELNKSMTEISIYNDYDPNKTLIYTYGSQPTCYIEGCKILQEIEQK